MAAAVGLSVTNIIVPILNCFRGSTFTIPSVYAELHTAIPGAGGLTAKSVGCATRGPVVFPSPPLGNTLSMGGTAPTFINTGIAGEVLSHLALWSLGTAGLFYGSFVLDAPVTWNDGDTVFLSTLSIALGPVAAT